jgi:hypothetical protein
LRGTPRGYLISGEISSGSDFQSLRIPDKPTFPIKEGSPGMTLDKRPISISR